MTEAEKILEKLPSVKIGLDDHYGKQTVLNALNQALSMSAVVGRSEQLVCPICSSDNVDAEFNHYNFCRDCNHDWAK